MKEQQIKSISFLISIVVVVVLYFKMCGSKKSDYDGLGSNKSVTKNHALVSSRMFVEEQLKSPSTAEYSHDYNNDVQEVNDSTFVINSWVDSQNGFGAMVRSKYSCTMVFIDENRCYCKGLVIN